MDFENFTEKTQEALAKCQVLLQSFAHGAVEPEHLLLSLLSLDETILSKVLDQLKIEKKSLQNPLEESLAKAPKLTGPLGRPEGLVVSSRSRELLELAAEKKKLIYDEFLSPEHIFIALLDPKSKGFASELLAKNGLTEQSFLIALAKIRGNQRITNSNPEAVHDALSKYCIDLTEQARQNKLDPVIGRDDEVRRVMQILSRRSKNNPVLVGAAGVGKTAIVEGLAQRVVRGDVPESLKRVRVLSLDMGSLIAGAKFRGEFEERLKAVVNSVQNAKDIVLFIDELHTVVGAGALSSEGGGMDASNLLKPALARGELHCIGATTIDEYRRFIEKDSALERRFQMIAVGEPDIEDTISILRGLKERYEIHHGVRIRDSALVAASKLSARYIKDRRLPDKAIDLIDEAAARRRLEIDSLPASLDEVERKLLQLGIEKAALQREQDLEEFNAQKISELTQEINTLQSESEEMRRQWQAEKETISRIRALKEKIKTVRVEVDEAERAADLQRAAELKYGKLFGLEHELKEAEEIASKLTNRLLKEAIDEDDIAAIVSAWTQIPVQKLLDNEMNRLLHLEEELQALVIGQNGAVRTISEAIRRARAGLKDPSRPIGSFLFLGPTGVGKTELAKAVASVVFSGVSSMIRLDMSEFQEAHSLSKLIGAPPGYVGYERAGQLTELVRRNPYSVILFDEVEKAHPEIFNTLLQVLDEGQLTDSQGRAVDFKNCIVILTSNLASQLILERQLRSAIGAGKAELESSEALDSQIKEVLSSHFRPEFLNRIDEIVVFQSLRTGDLLKIVEIQLAKLEERLAEKQLRLTVSAAAKEHLALSGYDPIYGARPLKRVLQKEIENVLASKILSREFNAGSAFSVDYDDEKLVFTRLEEGVPENDK